MTISSADLAELDLGAAIDRRPLVVAPELPVMTVIEQMSRRKGDRLAERPPQPTFEACPVRPNCHMSCALVVRDQIVLGIFTERDIVRLSAAEASLTDKCIADVMTQPVKTLAENELQNVFAVLFLFRRYRVRHLPIVDADERLVGLVSQGSLRRILNPANLLKLRRISEVMTRNVVWLDPQVSVLDVAKQMAEHRVSCVVLARTLADDRLDPVGILTERDIVQFQTLRLDLASLRAAETMSSPLILLDPEDSLWAAHQEMQRRHIRRLVVSWNWGKNLGLLTQTSLLSVFDPMEMYSIIESLQQTIQQLEVKNMALRQQVQGPTPPDRRSRQGQQLDVG